MPKKKKAPARRVARKSRRGSLHSDLPRNYWHKPTDYVGIGVTQWRLTLIRKGLPPTRIEDMVESFSWTEPADSAITTGEIQYRVNKGRPSLLLRPGDRIKCESSAWHQVDRPLPKSVWRHVWTMRCDEPSASVRDGTRSITFANDLLYLSRSIDDFNYSKSKKRPRGWRVSDAIRDIARRYGLRLGHLSYCNHRVKKFVRLNATPMRVINDLMLMQRNYSGRRYRMWFTPNGRYNIAPLRRTKFLTMLGPALIEAALQQSFGEEFATALTVRAIREVNKGKDKKKNKKVVHRKIAVKIKSPSAIRALGYVHRIVYAHGADSAAEARQMGLRHLAKIARMEKGLTITSNGWHNVNKGDAIWLSLPQIGVRQILYVAEITHSVSVGSYTMDVTVMFSDPYVNRKADRVNEIQDQRWVTPPAARTQPKNRSKPRQNRNKADTTTTRTARAATIPKPKGPTKGELLTQTGQR
jgi:hypothetical protein